MSEDCWNCDNKTRFTKSGSPVMQKTTDVICDDCGVLVSAYYSEDDNNE